jgi:transglutaminase-like putative cysteine protease
MNGLALRLYHWANPRELFKFLLLAVFLIVAVAGVAPLVFRSNLSLLLVATLFGLAAGWITGRVRLPAWAAGASDAALGTEFILLITGRLDGPLVGWLTHSISWISRLAVGDRGFAADLGPSFAEAGRMVLGAMTEAVRMQSWLISQFRPGAVFDPTASALAWGLGLCLIASFAGWALSLKAKPFAAIAPVVILVGVEFARTRADWRFPFLVVGMVMVILVVLEQGREEEEWDRKQIGYSTTLRADLLFSATPVVAVLLLLMFLVPSVSLDDIARWIREQSQPTAAGWGRGTPSGGSSAGVDNNAVSPMTNDFPWSHHLGQGAVLSDEIEIVIVTGEKLQSVPGSTEAVPPRHYWKAETYDYYTGGGWTADVTTNQDFPAKGTLARPLPAGIRLHQSVSINRSGKGPIYIAGELITVAEPYWLAVRSNGDLMGGMIALSRYEADSIVQTLDESTLRAAGTHYPDWVRSRYLQLPNLLPQRVTTLALSLTATQLTPYDQALAIQDYLRREMHYQTTVDFPPADQDVVDYFLFDSKTGFCDYYASAMVVLARAAGIPARYAMGYAPGIFDPAEGRFLVRQSDSHAWPELYFPGLGWVEFEPTSAIPEIQRSAVPSAAVAAPAWLKGSNPAFSAVWNFLAGFFRGAAVPALVALALAALGYLAWILLTPFRLGLLPPARMLRGMYRRLIGHARRLGVSYSPATTPAEFGRRLGGSVPADADPVRKITELYARQIYGRKKITPEERRGLIKNWNSLDRGLWGEWLRRTLRRKPNRR